MAEQDFNEGRLPAVEKATVVDNDAFQNYPSEQNELDKVDLFHNNDISAIMLPNICGSIWE